MRKHTRALVSSTVAALVALSIASSPVAFAARGAPQILIFQPAQPQPTSILFIISVVPGGSPTTLVLDYGTTPAMGSATAPRSIGDGGGGTVTVTQTIDGLKPDQTYYVELVASNALGSTPTGAEPIMTAPAGGTSPAPPTQPGRPTWSVEQLTRPPGAVQVYVPGVSCATPTNCVAVGFYAEQRGNSVVPLLEVREGARWSIRAIRWPAHIINAALNGVSCQSPSSCTVVGYTYGQNGDVVPLALVEVRGTWSVEMPPAAPGEPLSALDGVSCTSASFCLAVGQYQTNAQLEFPFAEVKRGATWHLETPPNPVGSRLGWLSGVSCRSPAACTAVGLGGTQHALIEGWNGARWSVDPSSEVGADENLFAVSCSAPSICTAVGKGNGIGPLVMTGNGRAWKVEPALLEPGSIGGVLSGVSCTPISTCTVVGSDIPAPSRSGGGGVVTAADQVPLVAIVGSHTWIPDALPSTAFSSPEAGQQGEGSPVADGISCPSASSCTVVGYYAARSSTTAPIALTTTP